MMLMYITNTLHDLDIQTKKHFFPFTFSISLQSYLQIIWRKKGTNGVRDERNDKDHSHFKIIFNKVRETIKSTGVMDAKNTHKKYNTSIDIAVKTRIFSSTTVV